VHLVGLFVRLYGDTGQQNIKKKMLALIYRYAVVNKCATLTRKEHLLHPCYR